MNFNSSTLVRQLADPSLANSVAPGQDVAERISLWIDAFNAMTLHAALQSIKAIGQEKTHRRATAARAETMQAQFQQSRAAWVKLICESTQPEAGDHDASFAWRRQHYLDVQSQLETKIAALRSQARQALSAGSPALRQLAMLDAVMEQSLAAREHRILARVPSFLERRFKQLKAQHSSANADAAPIGGHWTRHFTQELQQALLAELDVRLEPVVGLLEALNSEVKRDQ